MKIENFELIHSSDNSVQVKNTYQLLPLGVSWMYDGKKIEIRNEHKIIALILNQNKGIAIIESPYNQKSNKCYILNNDASLMWNVSDILKEKYNSFIIFDVYYICDQLYFFLNINNLDYRINFDLNTGKIGDLIYSH